MLSPSVFDGAVELSCNGHAGVSLSARGENMAGWWYVYAKPGHLTCTILNVHTGYVMSARTL